MKTLCSQFNATTPYEDLLWSQLINAIFDGCALNGMD